jgi:hypothetical protein
MSTLFHKTKLADGNEIATSHIGENNYKSNFFQRDKIFNCTFYNKDIKRYQTNLINNNVFKLLPDRLRGDFLNFCNNNSRNQTITWTDGIQPVGLIFFGGAVVFICNRYISKKNPDHVSYISNTYNSVSINKALSIGLVYSTEGLTKDKFSICNFLKLPNDEKEVVKIGNLIQNCSIKTRTSDQELKFNLMNRIDGHRLGEQPISSSQDDNVCHYRNSPNILSKILS